MSSAEAAPAGSLDLRGLVIPMVTPRKNGAVDQDGLKRMIDFFAGRRADIVFALGTTGEFQRLAPDQKETVVAAVARESRGRIRALIGISAPTPEETQFVLRQAIAHGADGVVLAPLFGQGSPDEKVRAVAAASELPVVLYTNSGITDGQSLDIGLVAYAKREYHNIAGIKDSSGNCAYFARLLAMQNERFAVLQGEECLAAESLAEGAAGIVAGTANVFPGTFRELTEKMRPDAAAKIQEMQAEISRPDPGNYIHALKMGLVRLGIISSDEMF